MKFRQILIVFLLFRLIDLVIIFLAQYLIPYLGFFPYKEIALSHNLPRVLTALANFDGAHYLLIAEQGYNQYQQAFFPLYPFLIRWFSPLFANNLLLTGILISNVSFLLGLWFFSRYLQLTTNKYQLTVWSILFLLVFPTSFFFTAVYTEGLFFLLFSGTLYFLKKEKYIASAIFAFLASLTKLIGVFLFIPIGLVVIKILSNKVIKTGQKTLITQLPNYLMIFLSPILGLTLYMTYLWKSTGDPFFFLHSQWAFGANRTSSIVILPQVIYRYLNIFLSANWNFQYFIALFEFFTFFFVFIILILDLIKNLKIIGNYNRFALNIFSLINLLLPTLTGTFSSIPRYALFSLSIFIFLAKIKKIPVKIILILCFTVIHVIMLMFFSQGYFVS